MELIAGLGFRVEADTFNDLKLILFPFCEPSLTLIADGIADSHYVISGTAVACGINEMSVFDEVHRSNMSKFWTSSEVANETRKDAQELYQMTGNVEVQKKELTTGIIWTFTKIAKNRWICMDGLGKVIKSPSYSAADIAAKLT